MIKKLNWDSDFFGYAVGQFEIDNFADINKEVLFQEAKDFRLVYILTTREINDNLEGIKLVDIQTTLTKELLDTREFSELNLTEYLSDKKDQQLNDLAIQSGAYSRFKTDTNFINNEFQRLYLQWIKDSIKRILADSVIVYKKNGDCHGFVTVKYKQDYAEIGLIAVHEQSRGKGIGQELITYASNLARDKGLDRVVVKTQWENNIAINLYKKSGFKITAKKYIYHLWN